MNPLTIHLAAQAHTQELHGVASRIRRPAAIGPARRTTIATRRLFGRAPRPAAT